ncbi:Beta-1,4-mannosyl-glycoprotein 4-beta-N-acetylglucosaminyltransferase [Perkinsus olseni]|nr:Beta-1,4-mannosyl-glycoprotein 4-beta-N-acetylglucosaminyltransferase [Perkinsus olseni]
MPSPTARMSVDYAPARGSEKLCSRGEKRPRSNTMFLKALLLKLCLMAFALCVLSLLWSSIRGNPANRAFLRERMMNLSVLVYGEEVYHMSASPAAVAKREAGTRKEKPRIHQPKSGDAARESPQEYDIIASILEEASRQVDENEAQVDLRRLGEWEPNPEFGDMERRAGTSFDWHALADRNHANFTVWAVRYMDLLRSALTRDPPSDLLTTVRPPDRRIRWDCEANRYMSGDRPSPVKIVDLLLFAYEFDVLEMRLYELDPLVDVFVIVETAKTLKKWSKPLMLGTVLNSPRFERFRHKIAYNVLDDSAEARYQRLIGEGEGAFGFEMFARAILVEKYVEAFGEPDDSVLFIHGDLDEMPTAEQVAAFKYCTPKDPQFPVVLQARFVSQNFAWIRTDIELGEYPEIFDRKAMRTNPHTNLLQPVRYAGAWTLDEPAIGAHTSYFTPVEGDLLKQLSFADGGKLPRSRDDKDTALALARNPSMGYVWKACGIRVCCSSDVERTRRIDFKTWIPWFAEANRHRYPHLFPSLESLEACEYVREQQLGNRMAFDRALSWAYNHGLRLKSMGLKTNPIHS